MNIPANLLPSATSDEPVNIFFAAGEVSGDRHAGELALSLRARHPGITMFGTGGDRMRAAGIDIYHTTSHLGTVGFQESFRFIKPLRSILRDIRTILRDRRPDLVVLVDNEGFNGLLARHCFREHIPFVYYFPPQVWHWGEWRARAIAKRARLIIPGFKPEADIYRREGGNVRWFGHPLVDTVTADGDPDRCFRSLGLDPMGRTIGLMPGSRLQELEQLADAMFDAARRLRGTIPGLQIVLPLAAPHLRKPIEQALDRNGMGGAITVIDDQVYTMLSKCECVLLSSGTATLEVALLGIPMVVCYRVTPFTYFLGRRLLKTNFIAMPNILAGNEIVPEVLQEKVTGERLAAEASRILSDKGYAATMRHNLGLILPQLGEQGVLRRAADAIYETALEARKQVRYEFIP
jgi:lipid-A-disaccharide synthase